MWFCLPPTRFIPARAEQDLEHYIHNELVNVILPTSEDGSLSQAICPGVVETLNCMIKVEHALKSVR